MAKGIYMESKSVTESDVGYNNTLYHTVLCKVVQKVSSIALKSQIML